MIRAVLLALLALAAAPAAALDRGPPAQRSGPLAITGPGSTGDVSGMSVTPGGATVANTLTALLGRTVYVTDFMPLGSTDITMALPAAVAALPSTGGKVILPSRASCYALTAAPTIMLSGLSIEGDGPAAACVTASYDGDTFKIGNGTTTVSNFILRNVQVQSSIAKTSGAAVSLRGTYNARLENLVCGQNTYVCLDVNGGSNAFMTTIDRLRMSSGYVGIRVGNDTGQPADITIRDPLVGSASRAGIELVNASGVQLNGGDVIGSGVGMLVDPGNGQAVVAVQTHGSFLDTSLNAGLKISPTGTGKHSDSTYSGLWTASNGQTTGAPGVLVQGSSATVRSITFNALRSFNNGGEGVRLEGGAYIDITGPQVGFNSLFSNNTYSGIYVAGGISNWSLTGGRSGAGTGFTQTNQQKYGLEIGAGSGDFINVSAIDLSGNVTGFASNGATGGNQLWQVRGAPYTFPGNNVGVGTATPGNVFTVNGASRPYTDVAAGGATAQIGTGTGANTDSAIFFGANAGSYAWMQCSKPGSTTLPCLLNPNGGPVALGKPSLSPGEYNGYPYIPVMSGAPTGAPQGLTGMAPFVIDGTNNKLCAYVNSAWKCATLQ